MDSPAATTAPGGNACCAVRAEQGACAKLQVLTIATIMPTMEVRIRMKLLLDFFSEN
jgi:hypothetical protein